MGKRNEIKNGFNLYWDFSIRVHVSSKYQQKFFMLIIATFTGPLHTSTQTNMKIGSKLSGRRQRMSRIAERKRG